MGHHMQWVIILILEVEKYLSCFVLSSFFVEEFLRFDRKIQMM